MAGVTNFDGLAVGAGGTITTADADGFRANNVKLPDRITVGTELLAASVDKWIFVADRAYQVLSVQEVHSVVGGSGATVVPRKVTAAGTAAPGAAAGTTVKDLLTTAFDLTAAINVSQPGVLSATPADYTLAAGDKIGLKFAGTLTGLVGALTISLKAV